MPHPVDRTVLKHRDVHVPFPVLTKACSHKIHPLLFSGITEKNYCQYILEKS